MGTTVFKTESDVMPFIPLYTRYNIYIYLLPIGTLLVRELEDLMRRSMTRSILAQAKSL